MCYPSDEMHGNAQRGKNSQYNILYQEAIKCVEEGMASDHICKAAMCALREARIKILGGKENFYECPETRNQNQLML